MVVCSAVNAVYSKHESEELLKKIIKAYQQENFIGLPDVDIGNAHTHIPFLKALLPYDQYGAKVNNPSIISQPHSFR